MSKSASPVSVKPVRLNGFMYKTDGSVKVEAASDGADFPEGTVAYFDSYNTRSDGVRVIFSSMPECLIARPDPHFGTDIAVVFAGLPNVDLKGFTKLGFPMTLDDECFAMWTKGEQKIVLCYDND